MKKENGLRILLAAAVLNGAVACGSPKRDDDIQATEVSIVSSSIPTEPGPTSTLLLTSTTSPTLTPSPLPIPTRKQPEIELTTEVKVTPTTPEVRITETPTVESQNEVNSLGLEAVDPIKPELKEQAGAFYLEWKARYVTNRGAEEGQLRVIDPHEDEKTRSEGMAYGLLLAVLNEDPVTFNKLWLYSNDYFNYLGLMDWDIGADGKVLGAGSATDADLDMAYALLLANNKWGGYENEAGQLLKAIWDNDVEKETLVLKPGGHWGGSMVTNPSYFALGYMSAFAKADGGHNWKGVGDKIGEMKEKGKRSVSAILWQERTSPDSGIKNPTLVYPDRESPLLLVGTVGIIEANMPGTRRWRPKYGDSGYVSFRQDEDGGLTMVFAHVTRGTNEARMTECGEPVKAEFPKGLRVRVVGVFGSNGISELLL